MRIYVAKRLPSSRSSTSGCVWQLPPPPSGCRCCEVLERRASFARVANWLPECAWTNAMGRRYASAVNAAFGSSRRGSRRSSRLAVSVTSAGLGATMRRRRSTWNAGRAHCAMRAPSVRMLCPATEAHPTARRTTCRRAHSTARESPCKAAVQRTPIQHLPQHVDSPDLLVGKGSAVPPAARDAEHVHGAATRRTLAPCAGGGGMCASAASTLSTGSEAAATADMRKNMRKDMEKI